MNENIFIREFDFNINNDEFIWHLDKEDRKVEVIENMGNWLFQFDNQLPFILKENIFIPKETYHRIIKGKEKFNLIVKIIKLD